MKTVQGTITLYVPEKTAAENSTQFEPASETHHFGFMVKLVEPGCTSEVQIEERSGRVTRITTTENADNDYNAIHAAVNLALDRMLAEFGI